MAIVKGLAGIKRRQEEQAAKAAAGGKKFPDRFFQVFPKRGDEIVVRFLQELDDQSENYREDRGVGVIAVEHQAGNAPKAFMTKALCSMDDEERCFGCEKHKANYKENWGPKTNLYINVLTNVDGELKTFVLDRNANSSFVQQLIDEAMDEDEGYSITNSNFKIKKTGSDKQTQWILKRVKSELLDDSEAKVWNIEDEILKSVPYSDQAAFYGKAFPDSGASSDSGDSSAAREARPQSTPDDEW